MKIKFGPTVIEGNPGTKMDWEKEAKDLEKRFDAGIWSITGKILDVVAASDLALTFAEIGMPLAWTVGMSMAGVAALLMSIGAPHVDAFNNIRKQQVLWGYSYGVLFGVDKRKMDFIKAWVWNAGPCTVPTTRGMRTNFRPPTALAWCWGMRSVGTR